jgi:hypothetical protein
MKFLQMYYDTLPALECLSREERGDILMAVMRYGLDGELPENLSEKAQVLFVMLRAQIDRDNGKYVEKCAKNKNIAKERERKRADTNVNERTRTYTNVHERNQEEEKEEEKEEEEEEKTKTCTHTNNNNYNNTCVVKEENVGNRDSGEAGRRNGEGGGGTGTADALRPTGTSAPAGPAPLKPRAYGEHNWIELTDSEHAGLVADHGAVTVDKYIKIVDEFVQSNGNKFKYRDWNTVIRAAIREAWKPLGSGTATQTAAKGRQVNEFERKAIESGKYRNIL